MQTAGSTAGTMTASVALTDSSATSFFTTITVTFTTSSTSVAALDSTKMTHVTYTQCPDPAAINIINIASA